MTGLADAKKRLLINIFTNLMNVGITSLILLWLTPYLVFHLGIAAYGMYPMIANIVLYAMIVSQNYTTAISRFMAVAIDKGNIEQSNIYFSTAILTLWIISLFILAGVLIAACFLPHLIQIPTGLEKDTTVFFVLMMGSGLLNTFTSPLWVATFVSHRLYAKNLAVVSSRLLQLAVIVSCFTFLGASLTAVGISRVSMFLLQLSAAYVMTRKYLPQIRYRRSAYSFGALGEMGRMSGWITIDTLGSLLYLSTDLILINIIAGSTDAGLYAIVLQWIVFLQTLTPAISNTFAPIAVDFIAKARYTELAFHARRAIKFIGLLLALPIGGLFGMAEPLIMVWIGPSFLHLAPLLQLLVLPQVIFLCINPLYNMNRGMNRVKIPAIVTICGGVFNLVLSVVLLKYTSLGLYAVAIATIFALMLRCIGFTPIYTAAILGQAPTYFLVPILPGLIMALIIAMISTLVVTMVSISSWFSLIGAGCLVGVVYIPIMYFLFLNTDELRFLYSLIGKKLKRQSS